MRCSVWQCRTDPKVLESRRVARHPNACAVVLVFYVSSHREISHAPDNTPRAVPVNAPQSAAL